MQDQHASQMQEYSSQYLPALNICREETGVTTALALARSQEQAELDSTRHERARLYARPACESDA
eukprot:COSAG05_NODE_1316_length_5210_cov_51.150851_3_plen_65_part_00